MPERTKAQTAGDINTNIPDNNTRFITPARLRSVLTNIKDSVAFLLPLIGGNGVTVTRDTNTGGASFDLDYASQNDAEAGTATDKPLNALRVSQAIEVLAGEVNKEDIVPFAALFRASFTRNWAASIQGGTNGQATVSDGNTVPQGAPAGTTDIVVVEYTNPSGGNEKSNLDQFGVGDWFRAKSGDDYIIAECLYREDNSQANSAYFWFNPSTADKKTLAYDTLANGSGEIAFFRQQTVERLREDLPTGTEQTEGNIDTLTKILLEDFDNLTVGELVQWHDDHHAGTSFLSGYVYTTLALGAGSPVGRVSFISGLLSITPLNDNDTAKLKSRLINGKTLRIWVSASRYKQVSLTGDWSETQGVLATNAGSEVDIGTILTNNHAVSIQIENNLPTRSELSERAFKVSYWKKPTSELDGIDDTWRTITKPTGIATYDNDMILHIATYPDTANGDQSSFTIRYGDMVASREYNGCSIGSAAGVYVIVRRTSGGDIQVKKSASTWTQPQRARLAVM